VHPEPAKPLGVVAVLAVAGVLVWWGTRPTTREPPPLEPEVDASRPLKQRECFRAQRLLNAEAVRLRAVTSAAKTLADVIHTVGPPTEPCFERPPTLSRRGPGTAPTAWITTWIGREEIPLGEVRVLRGPDESGKVQLIRLFTTSCDSAAQVISAEVPLPGLSLDCELLR
jgi:hypothetical protein